MTSYKFDGKQIPIKITYKEAEEDLYNQGIDLLDMFSENHVGEALQKILLNDRFMLKLWWNYIEPHVKMTYEEARDKLTPDGLQEFRDAFWEAVVNFTPPPVRKELREAWSQAKSGELLDRISKLRSSDSQPEVESSLGDTQ